MLRLPSLGRGWFLFFCCCFPFLFYVFLYTWFCFLSSPLLNALKYVIRGPFEFWMKIGFGLFISEFLFRSFGLSRVMAFV